MNAASRFRFAALAVTVAIVFAALPAGTVTAERAAAELLAASSPGSRPMVCTTQSSTDRCNANCPGEDVSYNPGNAQDIIVPKGYKIEVFARDLNFPTTVAFLGNRENFKVAVIESGSGLPGRCNSPNGAAYGGAFAANNPLTSDVLVLDSKGNIVTGPVGKPTASGGGFQVNGPAIGLAFERGFRGGTLFATDSNQGTDGGSPPGSASNNSSRIVTVDLKNNTIKPFLAHLPTGDHPTEQVVVKDGWIYWSQGSATNAAVVGHDNAGGTHQHDIPCQDIVLSSNTFDSGDGHLTSGYSDHGTSRTTVSAFDGAASGMHVCTGAIMRAKIDNPVATMQPISWGYRNPFGLRFSPNDSALKGQLFVTENGEDERGARPTNGAPDRLQIAQMNTNGTPDYHGWPDRFGDLASSQAVFNPVGGPADDACPTTTPGTPAEIACLTAHGDIPVRPILKYPPQQPVAALALEPADSAVVEPDFAPNSFVFGVVHRNAALVPREGDFGFSAANGNPEEGHDVQLVNFSSKQPLTLSQLRFAYNCKASNQAWNPDGSPACKSGGEDQAFTEMIRGINRPVGGMFGPDGAFYLVDYGAVRDFGQSDPASKFKNPADAPLVQIPFTGTIWRISRTTP